ncbi:hypothetical protein ACQEWB_33065 [Streptomyces sp. CA-249302]|uniref:hypothetical protein n=1 Tax=Streptomyces sp. CA-249302 TaxID=3240058 RepID=UPI003D8EA147
MSGLPRRRVWRWAVTVWAVGVVAGGLLTLWLQDSAAPPPPAGWERAHPSLSPPRGPYRATACPTPTAPNAPAQILCVVSTG